MINAKDARYKTDEIRKFREQEIEKMLKICEDSILKACTAGEEKCKVIPSWLNTTSQKYCIDELIRLGYTVVLTPYGIEISW